MIDKKIDRRIDRTRRSLKAALLALILEKGYDAVTVEEITNRADLGRTTFYLHYKDKEDLLLESLDEMMDDLVEQISAVPVSAWIFQEKAGAPEQTGNPARAAGGARTPILLVFQHAAEHADLYRVILRGEGASKAAGRMRQIINDTVIEFLSVKPGAAGLSISTTIPLDVFSNYFSGALLGFLTWWLESDVPYPPEMMAEMFEKLLFLGAREVMGSGG